MDVLKYLRRQFDYDAWANGEVLAAIKASETGSDPRPSRKLLAHILSAEGLWLERLRQLPQSLPVWPELTLEHCQAQIIESPRCGANISPSFLTPYSQRRSPTRTAKANPGRAVYRMF